MSDKPKSVEDLFRESLGDEEEFSFSSLPGLSLGLDDLNITVKPDPTGVGKIEKGKRRDFTPEPEEGSFDDDIDWDSSESLDEQDYRDDFQRYVVDQPPLTESQNEAANTILYEEGPTYNTDLNSSHSLHFLPIEESLVGYIYVTCPYPWPKAILNYLTNTRNLEDGNFPLAIELDGAVVAIRDIQPTPKTLHHLSVILQGYTLKIFDGENLFPFDKYFFLSKLKFSLSNPINHTTL